MKTKKEEYIDKMTRQLKDWSGKIDELESKVSTTAADIKIAYESRIRNLRIKRETLTRKMEELRQSSDSAWVSVKGSVEQAWEDLKCAFTEAKNKFKKAA